ncbi:MAG: lipopolysaccharide biosynthesis protein, partial [Prevotella sp.]|nr:lipopolysaccharide biosynthesis protein [Prevotella sp.]
MSDKSEINICNNDNRIAKNTIMLYFRMLLLMLVSLYTVRVVLAVLGDVDYGIFNVVGGIVSMFSFISASMVSASQRFLTFELAKGDTVKLRQTFSMILTIYIFFSIAIILLSETLGLAFIEYKLVIPESRNEAVLWVYHFSVLSFVFTILTIPYNAIIIAHEHMSVFAYISILEGVLRLLIVYLLCIFPCDKLKLYAILTFLVTLCISALYCAYSRWRYPESRCGFYWNKPLAKTILGYSGWNLLGAFSGVANS